MTPLIEVRGLRFQYEDGTQALDGVDFTLEPGETVALFEGPGATWRNWPPWSPSPA